MEQSENIDVVPEQIDVKEDTKTEDFSATCTNIHRHFAKRSVPKSVGVYIQGKIQNLEVNYTVDSGAGETMIDKKRVYDRIPEKVRPPIENEQTPSIGAGGEDLSRCQTVASGGQYARYIQPGVFGNDRGVGNFVGRCRYG